MTDSTEPDSGDVLTRTVIAWSLAAALAVMGAGLLLLPPAAALATAALAFAMVLITLTDIRHFIIPDVVSLPAIPIGILANAAVFTPEDWSQGVIESIWGLVLAGGTFFLLRAFYFWLRGVEGLGLGDVKLAAVAGAWLGPALLPPACFVASLAAICVVLLRALVSGGMASLQSQARLPFGSFIAPTIFIFWMYKILELIASM
ncbi:prepilin peptidase [Aestuariivirga sp.]|uniref:prepilin peptidase n=1 Tax=Aestuariivirga sp. TaxID=2650926 RepID=UPI003BAAB39F